MTKTKISHYVALDVGDKRIGYATADSETKFAVPQKWFTVDGSEFDAITKFVRDEDIDHVVVGYPRNMSGDKTQQTAKAEKFGEELKRRGLAVYFQDETLTSVKAEEYLRTYRKNFEKGDVDAHAAAIILTDFLEGKL